MIFGVIFCEPRRASAVKHDDVDLIRSWMDGWMMVGGWMCVNLGSTVGTYRTRHRGEGQQPAVSSSTRAKMILSVARSHAPTVPPYLHLHTRLPAVSIYVFRFSLTLLVNYPSYPPTFAYGIPTRKKRRPNSQATFDSPGGT